MANVRDSDTSLWLHNKLGTSNDSWTGGSICSQLNSEVLRKIKECFVDLQTQVKLKLLLSFFHIPRRNVEEWRVELEEILEVALMDSEQWVCMLAEILKTFPATGNLNMEIAEPEENRRIFQDLLNDLKKSVKKHCDVGMLPLECLYLNKNALIGVVGQQNQPAKHFTLKRKPKSAALRAELLQKSAEAANNLKKSSVPAVPLRSRGMPRKMTDTTPLKGIPSRVPTGGFRSSPASGTPLTRPLARTPAGKKEGGVKLLDINEQPLGYTQARKRKRQQEMEAAAKRTMEAQQQQQLQQQQQQQQQQQSNQGTSTQPLPQQPPPTPDYAAGLLPSNPPTPAPPTPAPVAATPATPTPAYVPQSVPTSAALLPPPLAVVSVGSGSSVTVRESQPVTNPTVVTAQQTSGVVQQVSYVPQQTTITVQTVVQATNTPTSQPTNVIVQSQQTGTVQPQLQAQGPGTKKSLQLTREQMLEAQEMFKTANRVTRPEKALILGFMAGSRENPCPHLGNIVTIKLSENQENVQQQDGSFHATIVETHFQMNYNTGEWKRIKKYRRIEEAT